jgi:hypothetical protein
VDPTSGTPDDKLLVHSFNEILRQREVIEIFGEACHDNATRDRREKTQSSESLEMALIWILAII